MRIKNTAGLVADVPAAIAQALIDQKGWVETTDQPNGTLIDSGDHALTADLQSLIDRVKLLESKPAPTGDVTKAYVDAQISALKVQTTTELAQTLVTVANRPTKTVSLPAVGMGSYADFTATSGGINWNHNAATGENYILIIIGVSIPAAIPASQAWTNTVTYGGVVIPRLVRTTTMPEGAGGTDKTHGYIEVYGGWITSTGKIDVQISTTKSDRYTLRGTSLSFSGVRGPKQTLVNTMTANRQVKITNGAASNRFIVCTFSPTSPATLTTTRTNGTTAAPIWKNSPTFTTNVTSPIPPNNKLTAPSMPFEIYEEVGAATQTFTSTTDSNVKSGTTGDGFSSAMIGVELEAW